MLLHFFDIVSKLIEIMLCLKAWGCERAIETVHDGFNRINIIRAQMFTYEGQHLSLVLPTFWRKSMASWAKFPK